MRTTCNATKILVRIVFASYVSALMLLSGCSGSAAIPDAVAQAGQDQPKQDEQKSDKKDDGPGAEKKHMNRLAKETSPYLLLHAHNPVDWYPWGEEAIAKAKKENKPIFLSIGYSSCHWCHVMERESFLDEEIAKFLNEHFVCVKVDREERPDVDSIYMTSLSVFNQLTGSGRGGGWPLSMFLTPDVKPFFGGTYFPARDGDRGTANGFLTIIKRVDEFWQKDADAIKNDAETIAKFTKQQLEGNRPDPLLKVDANLITAALEGLEGEYDEVYGGFGFSKSNPARPKFPEPSNLLFLINRVQKTKHEKAERMLVDTLERMAMGGIRDHLGGGFHRYSVDRYWQIPHFEKMLYDNGQLATVYSEAFALTGRDDFRRVVVEMLEFVLDEMRDEGGGFYSALDAESEDEEGKFYRWGKEEIQKLLTKDEYELFAQVYGLNAPPNFEEHYYAPQFETPLGKVAEEMNLGEAELDAKLAPMRKKLFDVRAKRKRPLTDTKILTSWNGMMIRGFADAGRLFKEQRYIDAAQQAAEFVLKELRTKDGRLLVTYGEGRAKLNAYVDDYALLADGLIALYQATNDEKWLTTADELTAKQIELFWDKDGGGFFFTSSDHESLLARAKNPHDSAVPAGNSVSAQNLIFLSTKLDRPDYLDKAEKTIRSISFLLKSAPMAAPRMMVAVSDYLELRPPDKDSPPKEDE